MKTNLLLIIIILFGINATAQDDESVDFVLVDIPPIAANCDPSLNNEELKTCFTKSVTNHLVSKINPEILQTQGLASGMYNIYVMFTINKKGKVKKIKAEFSNNKIKDHIISAVRSIDKMTPAYLNNKAVNVSYALPLKFKVH